MIDLTHQTLGSWTIGSVCEVDRKLIINLSTSHQLYDQLFGILDYEEIGEAHMLTGKHTEKPTERDTDTQ